MEYRNDKEFLKDFVERTKANYKSVKNGPYEVTQLINSMIGLLIIPQQKEFNRISDELLDAGLLDKIKKCVFKNTYSSPLDLKEISRHIRNAISHNRIMFYSENNSISSIRFTDKNIRKNEFIDIEFSVDLLEEFLSCFSDAISKL